MQVKTGKTGRETVNTKIESTKNHKRGTSKGMREFRGRLQLNLPGDGLDSNREEEKPE